MKRIFATLLAVMMIFSLTACQKESAPEPAPADPGSEEPAQEDGRTRYQRACGTDHGYSD